MTKEKADTSGKVPIQEKKKLSEAFLSLSPEARQKAINRVAQRRADMPSRYRKLYDRVMKGEATPRDAIKMHCLECWGWAQIETSRCDNYPCSLYPYRPYQSPQSPPESDFSGAESTNASEGDNYAK